MTGATCDDAWSSSCQKPRAPDTLREVVRCGDEGGVPLTRGLDLDGDDSCQRDGLPRPSAGPSYGSTHGATSISLYDCGESGATGTGDLRETVEHLPGECGTLPSSGVAQGEGALGVKGSCTAEWLNASGAASVEVSGVFACKGAAEWGRWGGCMLGRGAVIALDR